MVGAMLSRLLLVLALTVLPLAAAPAQEAVEFGKGEATVVTRDGEHHPFHVELATTAPQMARGLMFRKELAPDAGMLFVLPSAQMTAFWMKNTLIPLDMLFIAEDGRVVRIAERTTPMSTESISSRRPVIAVLELPGGTAERLGIGTGAKVESKALP
ncbi:hypothetical protein SAMN06265365_13821 [Tistlia consotensis]|uniref:DUF192 domain-containing protein n=2 Tax=Tistlia TaxID=1321364 RepID=A0A1Y6CMH8_9PROT|nr:hypothetical protein SAMN05428998_13742 [Tistlia consotensis USBA 355]SNS20612.1 hypothetical protein SAMN06265365_13821 [Tistlia consotensis]